METTSQQQARRKRRRKEIEGNETLEQPIEEVEVSMEPSDGFLPEITLKIEELPSRGVPYPPGSSLKYKTYSFGEVQKASISNMGALESVKMAVSGVEAIGFDKHQLTLFDALFIGVMRKVSSMTEMQFEMPYVCRGCEKTTTGNFSHRDIEFRDLDEDVTELPLIVEVAGKELHFAPMTVKDFMELYQGRHNNVLKNGKVDKVAVHATMVKNIAFKDAYEHLKAVRHPDDIEVLQEIDKMLLHDLLPLKTNCREKDDEGNICNTANSLKLEGREALLRPFRNGKGSVRTKIRIGNKQPS